MVSMVVPPRERTERGVCSAKDFRERGKTMRQEDEAAFIGGYSSVGEKYLSPGRTFLVLVEILFG